MDPVAPSIPPSYLVLHKLKQWDDCRTSAFNTSASNNQNTDLVHKQLIGLLRSLRYSVPPFHHDPTYDLNLHNESAPRVDRFLATHNIYGKEWQQMGFRRGPKPKVSAWSHVGTINAVSGGAVQSSEGPARQRPRYRDFGVISAASEAVRPGEGPARSKEKSMRPRWKDLSAMQIRSLAAQTTVAILAELGLPCAIFGSMACKLYGNQRLPNDVDILVLPPPERASITQEEIKLLISQHVLPNYHFVLKPARDPKATYKVLHFVAKPRPSTSASDPITRDFASMDLQGHSATDDNGTTHDDDATNNEDIPQGFAIPIRIPRRFSSKVDILLPGVMHLPALPTFMITQLSSLPLVPFPVLLLHKLQGWADHCAATEARYRAKIGEDGRDLEWCLSQGNVRHLLKYVKHRKNTSRNERLKEMWSDRTMFSEEFEALSRVRVREFCQVYTGLRETWNAIGFDV